MQHDGWDHALKVTAAGKGLVGHAGAVGAGAHPGTPGTRAPPPQGQTDMRPKNGCQHNQ